MTPNPVTINSATTIGEALKVFADKKFLALPVVDNGQLVGILLQGYNRLPCLIAYRKLL